MLLGHPLTFPKSIKSSEPKLEVITITISHPKNINISHAWSRVIILIKRISCDLWNLEIRDNSLILVWIMKIFLII